jgi:hypothetical protein
MTATARVSKSQNLCAVLAHSLLDALNAGDDVRRQKAGVGAVDVRDGQRGHHGRARGRDRGSGLPGRARTAKCRQRTNRGIGGVRGCGIEDGNRAVAEDQRPPRGWPPVTTSSERPTPHGTRCHRPFSLRCTAAATVSGIARRPLPAGQCYPVPR